MWPKCAARRWRWPPQLSFDETSAGKRGAGGDRSRQEPAETRRRRPGDSALARIAAARLESRCWHWTKDRESRTWDAASRTDTPPPAPPGTGLGAIARLSSEHDIYSRPDQGTVLMAQVWNDGGRRAAGPGARFRVSGVSCAAAGRRASAATIGSFRRSARRHALTVADGLGHGTHARRMPRGRPFAPRASMPQEPAPDLLERIHGALRSTRGAAVAVAEIDPAAQVVALRRRRQHRRRDRARIRVPCGAWFRMPARPATRCARSQEFTYPWDSRSLLVMHSDGLQTHWSFDALSRPARAASQRDCRRVVPGLCARPR